LCKGSLIWLLTLFCMQHMMHSWKDVHGTGGSMYGEMCN
jgi:hypothetical protein